MMDARWWTLAGRVLSAAWLLFGVAFFAMITSAGTESMELQIGPLVNLEGRGATLFVQGLLAFGLVMLVLFIAQRRYGAIMAVAWSAFWGLILPTTLVGASSNSERAVILLVVALFIWSGWYSWARWREGSRRGRATGIEPPVGGDQPDG